MLYQMAGRNMHGVGLIKEYYSTVFRTKFYAWRNFLVMPETPAYSPRQFGRCAVISNSGDLLKTKFAKEIDNYDVVIRENGAQIQNYTDEVGKKSTLCLLNRGSAKALDKVVELYETREGVLFS